MTGSSLFVVRSGGRSGFAVNQSTDSDLRLHVAEFRRRRNRFRAAGKALTEHLLRGWRPTRGLGRPVRDR